MIATLLEKHKPERYATGIKKKNTKVIFFSNMNSLQIFVVSV